MSPRSKKLTPEQLYAQAEERELLGVTEDGRLLLWDTGRVMPIGRFSYRKDKEGRRWIPGGKYVIDWFGAEVVAELGNKIDGRVSVQLMCNTGRGFAFTRRQITPLLRYQVIPDPVLQQEILTRLRELTALLIRSQDGPDRQRGEHPRRHLFRQPAEAVA